MSNDRYFRNLSNKKGNVPKDDKVVSVHADMPKEVIIPSIKIPETGDAPEIPEIKEPEYISLTVEQIREMGDNELKTVLSGEYYPEKVLPRSLQTLITYELNDRSTKRSSKSRWTKTPDFWLGVITIIIAAITLWFSYQDYASQNNQSDSPMIESDGYQESGSYQEKAKKAPETLRSQKIPKHEASDLLIHEPHHPDSLKTHKSETLQPKLEKQE